MVKLYETGAYLLNGSELVPDDGQAQAVLASKGVQTSKEDASKTQWHMESSKHTILRAIWNS